MIVLISLKSVADYVLLVFIHWKIGWFKRFSEIIQELIQIYQNYLT